jgi:hypothetical protein
MKKIITMLLVALILPGTMPVFPDTNSASVPVNVQIPMMLELNYWIRSCPSDSTPYGSGSIDAQDVSFGNLVWSDANKIWMADKYFTVFLVAMTSGRPYQIRQSCTNFASPSAGQNLNNTLLMTPDYKAEDLWTANDPSSKQGDMGSDRLGNKDLAYGADKLIYNSSGVTGPRIVRCYYGMATGDPSAHEPAAAQVLTGKSPSGEYNGILTFSLVLN